MPVRAAEVGGIAEFITPQGDLLIEGKAVAITAAQRAERLSKARYDAGYDSYLTLLDAQRTRYAAQQGLVAARLAYLVWHADAYLASPWATFDLRDGGWSAPAGLVAGVAWLAWRGSVTPWLRRPEIRAAPS